MAASTGPKNIYSAQVQCRANDFVVVPALNLSWGPGEPITSAGSEVTGTYDSERTLATAAANAHGGWHGVEAAMCKGNRRTERRRGGHIDEEESTAG